MGTREKTSSFKSKVKVISSSIVKTEDLHHWEPASLFPVMKASFKIRKVKVKMKNRTWTSSLHPLRSLDIQKARSENLGSRCHPILEDFCIKVPRPWSCKSILMPSKKRANAHLLRHPKEYLMRKVSMTRLCNWLRAVKTREGPLEGQTPRRTFKSYLRKWPMIALYPSKVFDRVAPWAACPSMRSHRIEVT